MLGDLGAQLGEAIGDERGRGLLLGQQAAHVGQLGRDGARGGAEFRHLVGDRFVARDDGAERDDLTGSQLVTRDGVAQFGDLGGRLLAAGERLRSSATSAAVTSTCDRFAQRGDV